MKIALTGTIGSGKSTAARRILRLAGSPPLFGLLSLPADVRDRSRGFRLLTLPDRRERVFAFPREDGDAGPGRFRVDRDCFDRFGADALRRGARGEDRLMFLDELGWMEREAAAYAEAVREAGARAARALVVVQERALGRWDPVLRAAGFGPPERVTARNRDSLPERLAPLLLRDGA